MLWLDEKVKEELWIPPVTRGLKIVQRFQHIVLYVTFTARLTDPPRKKHQTGLYVLEKMLAVLKFGMNIRFWILRLTPLTVQAYARSAIVYNYTNLT